MIKLSSPPVIENDFVLTMATVNGSGSQTANLLLVKSLFRMGIPVGGKNLFPSNIAGLATWFTIRANPNGYVSRRPQQDVVVTLNPATAVSDQRSLRSGGLFLHSTDCRMTPEQIREDIIAVAIPFRDLVAPVSTSVKSRKLLNNMIYVGILAEILPIDETVLTTAVHDQFKSKPTLVDENLHAIRAGREWAKTHLAELSGPSAKFPTVRTKAIPGANAKKVLIDGNTAAGMGLVDGGCTFASWYPITPASSLMEGFIHYADLWRRDADGRMNAAVLQAEDELSAICMVLGAGWAGARAATSTSGPGLSLMSEAAGLSYFAEIPAVIWNVQRAGPSTGLPTRTMQADVMSAAHLSHGDAKHILLFPSTPKECFEMARTAFDLSEQLQTLVIVMSDLDLGMNLHAVEEWDVGQEPYQRGKLLDVAQLEKMESFARYADPDGDGVGPRTLPGTNHPLAAYFTRGTGHDETSKYTEDPIVFQQTLERLDRKWETAKRLVPKPVIDEQPDVKIGLLAYGSTELAMDEIRNLLADKNLPTNYLRLRSFPFSAEVRSFLEMNDRIYIIEQNRDGQMRQLLSAEFPTLAGRFVSIVNYDGWPLAAEDTHLGILKMERGHA